MVKTLSKIMILALPMGLMLPIAVAEAAPGKDTEQESRFEAQRDGQGRGTGARDGKGRGNGPKDGTGNGPRRGNRTGPQDRSGPGCNK